MTKVIPVDFKNKRRVPIRTGYEVVDCRFDALTYLRPLYEHNAKTLESVKQENLRRIAQLNKLFDSLSEKDPK